MSPQALRSLCYTSCATPYPPCCHRSGSMVSSVWSVKCSTLSYAARNSAPNFVRRLCCLTKVHPSTTTSASTPLSQPQPSIFCFCIPTSSLRQTHDSQQRSRHLPREQREGTFLQVSLDQPQPPRVPRGVSSALDARISWILSLNRRSAARGVDQVVSPPLSGGQCRGGSSALPIQPLRV